MRSASFGPYVKSAWTGPSASRRRHPEGTLVEYIRHYNEHRPHRGLGLEAPVPGHTTVASPLANIARRSVLGGLIHEYHQLAG